MPNATPARADYEKQLRHTNTALAQLQTQNLRLVWIRTICFTVAVVGLFLGYNSVGLRSPLLSIGWLSAFAFLVAIVWHEHLRLAKLQQLADQALMQRLLARLDRDWDKIPSQPLLPEFANVTIADDLDIAGSASLLSLLSLAGTHPGQYALQSWIAESTSWPVVEKRQQAVRCMTEERDLRLSIIKIVQAHGAGESTKNVYGLPQWSTSPNWLPVHRMAHTLSYLGPTSIGIGAFLVVVALTTGDKTILPNVAVGFLGGGLLLNVLVTVFWGSWIHDIFQQVTGSHQATFQFAKVFQSLGRLPQDGGLLDNIRRITCEDPNCATRGFEQLLWRVRLANLQRDPLMYIVYLVLQLLILWDFRILKSLESWKKRFGSNAIAWFDALGTCEAIISSATLADENRDWAYPQPLNDASWRLRTSALGHPLLSDAIRVENDLELAAERPLLLVTGSNMAGKSTFLRSLGLNLLLARAGAPVCARRLETPLYALATSIRVRDSLRDGVSFFMAELRRLKEVVDQAHVRSERPDDAAPILFLLDEILQGTNSRERQLAVATVVERLLGFGACGLLSTHDLDLATVPSIHQVSQVVHFHEHFETIDGNEVMRFDYKMRPGSTPTTNALKLLKMVGLE